MPLYFPRNKDEEDFALNELPDDIGELNFSICFVCLKYIKRGYCNLVWWFKPILSVSLQAHGGLPSNFIAWLQEVITLACGFQF